jgi:hypothetical protein
MVLRIRRGLGPIPGADSVTPHLSAIRPIGIHDSEQMDFTLRQYPFFQLL